MKNLAFFYDTETTGLPLWHEPSGDPRQPHIIEFAAAVIDCDTREIVHSVSLVVRPDGWVIPQDVTDIHGITTEEALAVGLPEDAVLEVALDMWRLCRQRVGHNESFDARMLRIAIKRFYGDAADTVAEEWKAGEKFCTAHKSRPIVALPKNKMPTLSEAYAHFTGKELEGAHSAFADVQATASVYFGILRQYALDPIPA